MGLLSKQQGAVTVLSKAAALLPQHTRRIREDQTSYAGVIFGTKSGITMGSVHNEVNLAVRSMGKALQHLIMFH